ncbi:uncharacterized protein LOC129788094 [Lutzomyia longipalpis]|uniref:uncharacterized protein LOC129788094 n=1 Tax=Lutzomyia longipalpis TaxID=7200 RepID=UPI002483F69F|nr:uncharacterized protein LOC129788094 [Lutzomyia longipalpis]
MVRLLGTSVFLLFAFGFIGITNSIPATGQVKVLYSWSPFTYADLPHSEYSQVDGYNYYIPKYNLPTAVSLHIKTGCMFMPILRSNPGIPATVTWFNSNDYPKGSSPVLRGFPTYEDNYVPGWFGVNTLENDDYLHNIYPGYDGRSADTVEGEEEKVVDKVKREDEPAKEEAKKEEILKEEKEKAEESKDKKEEIAEEKRDEKPEVKPEEKPEEKFEEKRDDKEAEKQDEIVNEEGKKEEIADEDEEDEEARKKHKPGGSHYNKPGGSHYNKPGSSHHNKGPNVVYVPVPVPAPAPVPVPVPAPPATKPPYKPVYKPDYEYEPEYKPTYKPKPTYPTKPTYQPTYQPTYKPTYKPTKAPSRDLYHFVAVYYTNMDNQCDRLFFVDYGVQRQFGRVIYTRRPVLWAFPINECSAKGLNQPPVLKVTIPDKVFNDPTGFSTAAIDIYGGCNEFAVYIANCYDNTIIVYDNVKRYFWYYQSETFQPGAERSLYTGSLPPQDSYNFGVMGLALGATTSYTYKDLYYAPGSSYGVFKTTTDVIRNKYGAPGDPSSSAFSFLGYGGIENQSIMLFDDQTEVLFFIHLLSNTLQCWNTNAPLEDGNVVTLFSDLEFGVDMLLDGDRNLRFLLYNGDGLMLFDQGRTTNPFYQLYYVNIDYVIKGTACDPSNVRKV